MQSDFVQSINQFLALDEPSRKDIWNILNAVDEEITVSKLDEQRIEAIYALTKKLTKIYLEKMEKNLRAFVSEPLLYHLEHTCTTYLLAMAHNKNTPEHIVKDLISHKNLFVAEAATSHPNSPFASFV